MRNQTRKTLEKTTENRKQEEYRYKYRRDIF